MTTYKVEIAFTEVLYGEVVFICEFTLDYDNQVTYNTLKSDAYKYASQMEGFPKEAVLIKSFEYKEEYYEQDYTV